MPYADEALVLMPTLDVRLIEAKVPLANAKKLQQILPNLIEEYVLTGVEAIAVQAFPPVPGVSALQRTLALIDRSWLAWLTKQLEGLLSHRVRLIPDCLILAQSGDSSLAYFREDGNLIFTQRTGEQLGVAWVELETSRGIVLPQTLGDGVAVEFSWDWLAQSAHHFLQVNSSSRSANFALNLLPKTFKREGKKSGLASLSSLTRILARNRAENGSIVSGLLWTDPLVWRQAARWTSYWIATVVIGFILHLSWLTFDNWRWGNQMELLAAQSLTPASVAALAQAKSSYSLSGSSKGVLGAFIKQATEDQRRLGVVTDADFAPMAAKLQQLKSAFGAEVLQKIDYDGYGIEFEFKLGSVSQSPQEVARKARALGMAVKSLGGNRYRLEPYAGLGLSS